VLLPPARLALNTNHCPTLLLCAGQPAWLLNAVLTNQVTAVSYALASSSSGNSSSSSSSSREAATRRRLQRCRQPLAAGAALQQQQHRHLLLLMQQRQRRRLAWAARAVCLWLQALQAHLHLTHRGHGRACSQHRHDQCRQRQQQQVQQPLRPQMQRLCWLQ
jgi:hypothetical protein